VSLPWLTCTYRHRRGGWVCASVAVFAGLIVEAAPILAKFKGQRVQNLERWVESVGGTTEWVYPDNWD
jgi:hypothetical protein